MRERDRPEAGAKGTFEIEPIKGRHCHRQGRKGREENPLKRTSFVSFVSLAFFSLFLLLPSATFATFAVQSLSLLRPRPLRFNLFRSAVLSVAPRSVADIASDHSQHPGCQ